MRAKSLNTGNERKGVILLVVLAMLTLLTVLGITFVLYADSSEATARINLESEKIYQPQYTEKELLQHAIGQLVFDVEDDTLGQQSAMRGHSLARDMYGYRYDETAGPGGPPLHNDRPFRGTGRLNSSVNIVSGIPPVPEKQLINFSTFYNNFSSVGLSSEFVRDPERPTISSRGTGSPPPYIGGFNPPYTYADLNHAFLAKVDPATGEVVEPSFVRREAMETQDTTVYNLGPLGFKSISQAPAWSNQTGKYQILRPRPRDHSAQFPEPNDDFGDVRNLPWGTHNDAIWMDLGVAPKTAPNGKKYKPLFAYTIVDLDGRVNVNAHGNLNGNNDTLTGVPGVGPLHSSRSGAGPWEVSLTKAIGSTGSNLLNGITGISGRFNGSLPSNLYRPVQISVPHSHSPIDFNASTDSGGANSLYPIMLPGSDSTLSFTPFGYGYPDVFGGGGDKELTTTGIAGAPIRHASGFNPYFDLSTSTPGNRVFGNEHFAKLLGRRTRSSFDFQDSDFWKLGLFGTGNPFFASGSRDIRIDRVTTLSWDLDRPGLTPYLPNKNIAPLTVGANWVSTQSVGSTPNLYPYSNPSSSPVAFNLTPPTPLVGDYDPKFQSLLAKAKRLNLQRPLPNYPNTIDPATGNFLPTDNLVVNAANNARISFAQDIFNLLILATGAFSPGELTGFAPNDPNYQSTRWLAQIAVNMVDHFDPDEVMTVFDWLGTAASAPNPDLVVGVELPRLAINEVYAQVENKPSDFSSSAAPTGYRAKVYLELVNPLLSDPNYDHSAALNVGTNNIYKIELVNKSALFVNPNKLSLSNLSNMVGDISSVSGVSLFPVYSFDNNPAPSAAWSSPIALTSEIGNIKLKPNNGLQSATIFPGEANEKGFVVIGPSTGMTSNNFGTTWNTTLSPSSTPEPGPDFATPVPWVKGDFFKQDDLWFPLVKNGGGASVDSTFADVDATKFPAILIRRLANPYLPFNLTTNPYVTVDMVEVTKEMVTGNDARNKKVSPGNSAQSVANTPTPISSRKSFGRKQLNHHFPAFVGLLPALGNPVYGNLVEQDVLPAPTRDPIYTFWKHNYKQDSPSFDAGSTFFTPRFITHLDRPPTTFGEVLTVPTCKPHEVYWLNNQWGDSFHGWLDPNTRLYRFLEMVQAGNTRLATVFEPTTGTNEVISIGSEGGRIPGKINLNTCSKDVFMALCDQNIANRFTPPQLEEIWSKVLALRPFWGFGVGNYNGPSDYLGGVNIGGGNIKRGTIQSLLAEHPAGSDIVTDPLNIWNMLIDFTHARNNDTSPMPYLPVNGTARNSSVPNNPVEIPVGVRLELFNKIVGNSTTRSNCFAIWLTVGFFEVVSEDGIPGQYTQKYILGKELQPRTRKRFFSLIDRTQLETWRVQLNNAAPLNPNPTGADGFTNPVQLPLNSLTHANGDLSTGYFSPITGKTYPINPSTGPGTLPSVLTIDPGSINEETVEVIDIGGGTPGIILRKPHGINTLICNRGNPGPIPREKVDLDDFQKQGLIPYFQVLE
jgi:hypothetical protein